MDRRFIIAVCTSSLLVLIILLSLKWNQQYNTKIIYSKKQTDSLQESFAVTKTIDASQGMTTRPCTVYYTKNVDICNDSVNNWYRKAKTDIYATSNQILLNQRLGCNISIEDTQTLATINKVLEDYDSLPFKQQCKLTMYGLSEPSTHPYKINLKDDAPKRGDPSHWAFCLEENPLKVHPGSNLKTNPAFTKVFQPSGLGIKFPDNVVRERYDMKSLYDDDLLNVHCAMYEGLSIQSGSISSTYNGRDMLEVSYDINTKRITGVRPVYYHNRGIYVSNETRKTNMYAKLFEITRNGNEFVVKRKNYKPIIYRMLFNLCNAPNATAVGSAPSGSYTLAFDKGVELIVERQRYPIQTFFELPQGNALDTSGVQTILQSQAGITRQIDISDLNIETRIPQLLAM